MLRGKLKGKLGKAAPGECQASPHMHESVRLEHCHLHAGLVDTATFTHAEPQPSEDKASSSVSIRPSRGSLPPPPPPEAFAAARRPSPEERSSRDSLPPPPPTKALRPAALPGLSRNSTGPAELSRRQSRRLQNRTSTAPYVGASSSTGCRRVVSLWPGLRWRISTPSAKAPQRAVTSTADHLRPHARRLTPLMGAASVAGLTSFDAIAEPGVGGLGGGGSGGGGASGASRFPPSHFPPPPADKRARRPAAGGGTKPPPTKKATALPFPEPPSRCR